MRCSVHGILAEAFFGIPRMGAPQDKADRDDQKKDRDLAPREAAGASVLFLRHGLDLACGDGGHDCLGIFGNWGTTSSGEVVGDGLFFIEAQVAGIGADETLIEDAAGEAVELLVFEGLQQAGADFGGRRHGVKRHALTLALAFQPRTERFQRRPPLCSTRHSIIC